MSPLANSRVSFLVSVTLERLTTKEVSRRRFILLRWFLSGFVFLSRDLLRLDAFDVLSVGVEFVRSPNKPDESWYWPAKISLKIHFRVILSVVQ